MIIQSLRIDRFGKWKGLKLKNLETGVNLFYGPNEAGKTTLMQFLRTIFTAFRRIGSFTLSRMNRSRRAGKFR